MPHSSIVAGLDIGTNSTKIIICHKKFKEENLQVLGTGETVSSGIRKDVVVDIEKAAETIKNALSIAQESSGQKVDSVYVNIGGGHIFVTSSHGLISVSRADQKISEIDIERVIQAAQTFSLPPNREILEVFPKEFIVDGEKGIKEPLGMQGVRLEAEILALCGFSPFIKNLTQAVLSADLHINDLVPSPLASARAVLNPRQRELGVAVLDIGAGTTGLAVFEEGTLIHTSVFPVGSANITSDIAIGLKTDIDTAEKIKLEFGSCIYTKSYKKGKISIPSTENHLVFSQKMLVDIVEARVSEIFDLAQKELKKISRAGLLPAGIVLTGGGAKLPKIVDLAKKELKLPARIGVAEGFFPTQEDPSLSTVCGLVLGAADSLETGEGFPLFFAFGKNLGNKIKKIFRIFIP
ncbi:MAG: cell division protein FtsA [Candidatus Nealsonbacteria bacterium CG_4_10_14_0_2_um_filter_38_17]|uniref:Cell division protein FtsA n=2 Tax=Candidatus Nealsoniibacteriota TaxID=1817911 RepID=A0A2M7UYM7_9BACT|nr:MAG: cell division protein FtsA [Candidatus Nealsonbacteria bacterium CG23_combo_of_CG06-09_8_20_14_all_38_19]PIZ89084.1 MAG: cell division protein FtsA [Candidatus Nealsonbacteria bacterium CG_4_10_14_0_2_um_filter_38_17]